MILTLVLLGALLPFHQRLKARLPDGALGLTYLGLYGLGRFFLSYLRTDPAVFAGLRQAQLASMLMFVIAVVAIPILVRRQTSAVHHELVLEPAFAPATTPSHELETAPEPEPAPATTSEVEPAASPGPSAESGAPAKPARPHAPRRPRTKTSPKTPEPPDDLPG
jgi:phosphatidylglycerol:prolipoprotein diacylglycerol transferase